MFYICNTNKKFDKQIVINLKKKINFFLMVVNKKKTE